MYKESDTLELKQEFTLDIKKRSLPLQHKRRHPLNWY